MKLNHNSISAKLYRWFYGTKSMPSNLCPYFWKLVISYLFALPLILLTFPYEIINFKDRDNDEPIGFRVFVSFIVCFFVFAAFAIIVTPSYLFGYRPTPDHFMYNVMIGGLMLWIVGTVVGVYYGIKYLVTKIKDSKNLYDEDGDRYYGYDANGNKIYYQEEKPNIIVEFIKAKYNKYCPKIEWKK